MIVDDQLLFAQALTVTIDAAGHSVVAVAENGTQALKAVREHQPDLVLLDIGLLEQSGIAVGRAILELRPQTKVVALTVLDDAQTAHAAIRAGFHGYLLKDMPSARFVRALGKIEDGRPLGSPRPRRARPRGGRGGSAEDQLLLMQLTARELEVLGLIAEGLPNGRLAARLGISPHTVRSHINAILSKLQLRSRLEAAAFAVRNGLAGTPP